VPRQAVSCPDSHSLVCTLCDSLHVELFGGLAIGAFVLLTLLPVPAWPAFLRVFQLPFSVFDFRFKIDQSLFAPVLASKRPMLFVVVPHGVVPIGCFMSLGYIWSFLPGACACMCVRACASVCVWVLGRVLRRAGAACVDGCQGYASVTRLFSPPTHSGQRHHVRGLGHPAPAGVLSIFGCKP
jgi:hypothetical protein